MSNSLTTKTIDPDWLGKSDVEFISELVQEWMQENNPDAESFSFEIRVNWENNDE